MWASWTQSRMVTWPDDQERTNPGVPLLTPTVSTTPQETTMAQEIRKLNDDKLEQVVGGTDGPGSPTDGTSAR